MTIHYHVQGLEIVRVSKIDLAKTIVARSSNSSSDLVQMSVIGTASISVKEVIIKSIEITEGRKYSFLSYNCRHFVIDLLSQL